VRVSLRTVVGTQAQQTGELARFRLCRDPWRSTGPPLTWDERVPVPLGLCQPFRVDLRHTHPVELLELASAHDTQTRDHIATVWVVPQREVRPADRVPATFSRDRDL